MPARPIVLDANILIRFVLGERVPALLAAHATSVDFLTPDTALEEARKHLPTIVCARGDDGTAEAVALAALDAVSAVVTAIPASSYEPLYAQALARIGQRDAHDWPVLACALLLSCPIWTEDHDGRRHLDDGAGRVVLYRTGPRSGRPLTAPPNAPD